MRSSLHPSRQHPPLRLVATGFDVDERTIRRASRLLNQMVAERCKAWAEAAAKHRASTHWLGSMEILQSSIATLSTYIVNFTRERITESDHALLLNQECERLVPVPVIAEWIGDDVDASESLLTGLFHAGLIAGEASEDRINLKLGSFYEWWGRPLPLCPEWGADYEVVPDEQADEAQRENAARERARQTVEAAINGGGGAALDDPGALEARRAEIVGAIVADSREIAGVVRLVSRFADEFGVDPLEPRVRKLLDTVRAEFAALSAELGGSDECDLPQPNLPSRPAGVHLALVR